ncbi:MAG: Rad52/Rad22 family DNA repair protein [Longimicrobiaceae bacterium]
MRAVDSRALQTCFHREEIEWRIQQAGEKNGRIWAICVPYVTNRAIQSRLDEVVGPENWKNEFRPGPDGGVVCGISLRVGDEWVTKWDGAENTDVEGVKGGLSAAMKRAAVQWGIGRYLYALEDSFATVHEEGRYRARLKDGTSFRWDPPDLPAWALPRPQALRTAEHEAMLEFIREVGARCEEEREIRVGSGTRNLKAYIRENWPGIKEQYRLARAAIEAIEASTGEQFRQAA